VTLLESRGDFDRPFRGDSIARRSSITSTSAGRRDGFSGRRSARALAVPPPVPQILNGAAPRP
jgi:hypothetical protein